MVIAGMRWFKGVKMGEALGDLGINLPGLIGQLISFVALMGILIVLGYKPIIKMLDERSRKISEGIEKSELAGKKAAEIDIEAQNSLDEARKEGQTLIAQATETGNRLREEAKQSAKEEGQALISRARAEIQMERDQAIDQLRKEFADIAILAAEKVINESLDKTRHRKIIDDVLEKSSILRKE